jgi:signal transduction histidine kinase
LTWHFLSEVISYGIGVPAMGIFLLSWVDRAEKQKSELAYELNHLNEYIKQLNSASTWDQLSENIVQFPKLILPAVRSCLTIYNADKGDFDPVATWVDNGSIDKASSTDISLDLCGGCSQSMYKLDTGLSQCPNLSECEHDPDTVRYCLALAYRGQKTGSLIFDTPADQPITSKQQKVLEKLAPEIAIAVDNARLDTLVNTQIDAATTERARIARDLHDTLGQNISFLRFKLDQVSMDDPLLSIKELRDEIDSMRTVADEAYAQMRGTLAELHPDSQIRLDQALRSQVKPISTRAGFTANWHVHGTPRTLRPHTSRQILYICREVMNNIEKHAHAEQVNVELSWGEADLTITIKDDGNGFNPRATLRKENLGMTIMAERAQDINSQLMIDAEPGQGSTVSLQVPYK